FLAEIQQTSDVTYRIYDFDRHDDLGRPRELHTELAAESINYEVLDDYQTHYTPAKNQRVQLVDCPYFTTSVYDIDQPVDLDYTELDSFVILIPLSGAGIVTEADGTHFVLRAGETVLLPATATRLRIEGTVKFLETYVG
ncbi:MAG: mannose-6-phosphate isomerase, partial [Prevotella sp.]|nr:mannose-6-phosphate isomerase [Prevotella sp.]